MFPGQTINSSVTGQYLSDHVCFSTAEKVQAEIDRVIGQSRQPSMADRADMPYTEAVLHEIQRMGNIAPLGLPRVTTKDVHLGDYLIPKVNLETPSKLL